MHITTRHTRRNRLPHPLLATYSSIVDEAGGVPPASVVVCRACSTARGCKSPLQPDGGEVVAKRKGVVARRGLKEARSKRTSRLRKRGVNYDLAARTAGSAHGPWRLADSPLRIPRLTGGR